MMMNEDLCLLGMISFWETNLFTLLFWLLLCKVFKITWRGSRAFFKKNIYKLKAASCHVFFSRMIGQWQMDFGELFYSPEVLFYYEGFFCK